MKALLILLTACSVMLTTQTVQAQATTLTSAQQKKVIDELKKLGGDLNLTSAQKDQMRSILGDEVSQMDGVRNNTGLSKAEKRAKMMDIRTAQHAKIANVLSPDQLTKWEQEVSKYKKSIEGAAAK